MNNDYLLSGVIGFVARVSAAGTSGALQFSSTAKGGETLVQVTLPHLEIATILVIE